MRTGCDREMTICQTVELKQQPDQVRCPNGSV